MGESIKEVYEKVAKDRYGLTKEVVRVAALGVQFSMRDVMPMQTSMLMVIQALGEMVADTLEINPQIPIKEKMDYRDTCLKLFEKSLKYKQLMTPGANIN